MELLHADITEKVIAGLYQVQKDLGAGLHEVILKNSLIVYLQESGLSVVREMPVDVRYSGHLVGEVKADLVVEGRVLLELKAVQKLLPQYESQMVNYLACTHLEVGLLMNFGPSATFVGGVLSNDRKPMLVAKNPR